MKTINVELTDKTYKQLNTLCFRYDHLNFTDVVECALKDFLNSKEKIKEVKKINELEKS